MAAALLAASCSGVLRRLIPAEGEPENNEVNLVFVLENNLVILPSLTVDGRPGRFLFGSAAPRTVLDPRTRPASGTHELRLNQRETLRFSAEAVDLQGVADRLTRNAHSSESAHESDRTALLGSRMTHL